MNRRTFLEVTGASVGLGSVAGCSAPTDQDGGQTQPSPTPTATATKTPTATEGDQKTIQMVTDGGDYYFDPIGLFVEPGETVTWTIKAGSHSTTAYVKGKSLGTVTRIPANAEFWNSNVLSSTDATFEHKFTATGTYDYYCIPHKSLGMVGRLVVGEPGGPAEGSMPPDGKVPSSQTTVDQTVVPYDEFTG
jgi:plastocyanin